MIHIETSRTAKHGCRRRWCSELRLSDWRDETAGVARRRIEQREAPTMGSYAPTVGSVILLHRLSRRVSNDRRSIRTTMSVVSDDPPKIESFQRADDPMDARASPRGRSHNLAIRRNLHLGLLDDLLGRHRHPWPNSPTVGAPVCCVVAYDGLRRRHEKRDGRERHEWCNQKSASRDHFSFLSSSER